MVILVDFATLMAYCHFPDMTDFEPRRFHTLDDIEEVVGRRDRFCVAARRGNVTWLPIYMLSPFLFSDDTSLDFGALRLDSFAERVLMATLE